MKKSALASFRKNGRIIRILGNRDADLLLYFCRRYIVIRPTVTFSVLGSKTQNDLFGLFASLRDVHPAKIRLPICTFPIFGVSTCKYRPGKMHIPPSKTRNVQVFNAFSTCSLEGDSAVPFPDSFHTRCSCHHCVAGRMEFSPPVKLLRQFLSRWVKNNPLISLLFYLLRAALS